MLCGTPFRKYSIAFLILFAFSNKLSLCFTSCDLVTCNRHLENLLSHSREDGTETLSRKTKDFLKCVGECYHELFPNFIPKSAEKNLNLSEKLFNGDAVFYLNDNWECVAQNYFPLLTCLAVVLSMKSSIRNDKAYRLLSCKKATALLNCPQEVLFEKCGETTADAMHEIFHIALKNKVETACQGVSSGALSSLHTYNRLRNKFMEMAACIDIKKLIEKNCLQEFLTDSYAVKKYMCCGYSDLISCMTKDSDECVSTSTNASFFRSMLSLGEDKCYSVEDCPQEDKHKGGYDFEISNNSDLLETSSQEMNFLSSEVLPREWWKKENVNTPVTKYTHMIHQHNNTQILDAYTRTPSILNEGNKEENTEETNSATLSSMEGAKTKTEETNSATFSSMESTKTKTELENLSTYENTRSTTISMFNIPHGELVINRAIPSPCAKIEVDMKFVILLLSITIFH